MSMIVALALVTGIGRAALAQRIPVEMRTAVLMLRSGDSLPRYESTFDGIRDVKASANGTVFVLARKRVHVFDPKGTLVRAFDGKSGQHPAFVDPVDLEVSDTDVTVRDLGARQWLVYSIDGTLRSFKRMPAYDAPNERIPMRGGSALIVTTPLVRGMIVEDSARLSLDRTVSVDPRSGKTVRLFSFRMDSAYFKPGYDTLSFMARDARRRLTLAVPRPTRFGASGAWARSGDSVIATADGTTGQITWYSLGESGAIIADTGYLGRRSRPVTTEDVSEETARLQRLVLSSTPRSSPDSTHFVRPVLFDPPTTWSIASRALFASDGALWVGVNRMYYDAQGEFLVRIGDENTWAVFPARGSGPAFTVSLRPLFRLTAVVNGRLYGYVDNGVTPPTVEVYSVVSK